MDKVAYDAMMHMLISMALALIPLGALEGKSPQVFSSA